MKIIGHSGAGYIVESSPAELAALAGSLRGLADLIAGNWPKITTEPPAGPKEGGS